MLKEDREKPEKKPTVVVTQTPINHPALITRAETLKEEPKVETKTAEPKAIPEGAEYIPVNETVTKEPTAPMESQNDVTPVVSSLVFFNGRLCYIIK